MKRREFIAAAVGAVIVPRARWITVAHGGVNRNSREYSPAALESMARSAKGSLVRLYRGEGGFQHLGICTAARLRGDSVQIRMRWFGGCYPAPPPGSFITPTGRGTSERPGRWYIGPDYRLEHFALTGSSAFQRATRI